MAFLQVSETHIFFLLKWKFFLASISYYEECINDASQDCRPHLIKWDGVHEIKKKENIYFSSPQLFSFLKSNFHYVHQSFQFIVFKTCAFILFSSTHPSITQSSSIIRIMSFFFSHIVQIRHLFSLSFSVCPYYLSSLFKLSFSVSLMYFTTKF